MDWINHTLFPFTLHHYGHKDGTMTYVDEGQGAVILCVHGTPTWSLLWRHAIAHLSQRYRVISIDHLGFGASDKPTDADYTLAGHARRIHDFINHLNLSDIVLVVHDYGGPIGLADVLQRPSLYRGIVVLNSFLWPFRGEFTIPHAARLLHSRLGRYLYLQHNLSPRWLIPNVFGNKALLDPAVHQQYQAPFARPDQRHALWACVQELDHATPWLEHLWQRRNVLADIPATIVWGDRDPVYGPHFLRQWQRVMPHAPVTHVAAAGHFVQEEAPEAYVNAIERMMSS